MKWLHFGWFLLVIGLGSISNEKRKFTLIGVISSVPINSTYDPMHNPCNATPSCLMSSLNMVSPRSTGLSIANDNLEGSLNKPMVHLTKKLWQTWMWINNMSIAELVIQPHAPLLGRRSKILLQHLKTSMVTYFPYIIIQLFGFLVFLWGCNLVISMVRKFQGAN
jgi:hypothetical protein